MESWILPREGEWGEVQNDFGGKTRWGISKRAFPDVDLDNLDWPGAKSIYLEHFWKPIKGDALGWPVGLVVFDTAVQLGASDAVKELQRVVGAFPDGSVGPDTLKALVRLGVLATCQGLLYKRIKHHIKVWKKNPEQPLSGWLNRVMLLGIEVGRAI